MSTSQQRPHELNALVAITEILTGQLPYLDKCRSVLAVLAEFTGSELVTLRELEPENSTLNLIASYNDLIPIEDSHLLQSISSALPAKALGVRVPVVVNDYPSYESRHQGYLNWGVKSALTLPVQIDGEVFGVLGFASKSLDHYQEDGVGVLVAIGAAVGMMIAKAGLQEDNEVEANIGRIVSSPLVGPDVFERFAAEAARIIDFDRLALNSVNLKEGTYVTEFLIGDQLPSYALGKVHDLDHTGAEVVVRSRSSQRINFAEREGTEPKFPKSGPFMDVGQPHLLGVPLVVGDQIIGTMGFIRGSHPFSLKDVGKAERLGSLVAGAFADFKLQHVRIEAESQIRKNGAILEAEAAIGRILSSPLSGTGAFETLSFEIAKVIPLDRVVIVAIDLETETFSPDFNEFLSNARLIVTGHQGHPYAGSITAEVVRSGKVQRIDSDDPRVASGQLPIVREMNDLGYRSMMGVPLEFEGRIIGTMIILSKSDRTYSDDDMTTAVRIGHSVAGALATFKITAERDRAQEALAESETRYRQIADSIGGVFWLTELEPRRLIYASPKFQDLWDIPVSEVYDDFERWYETIHPEDLEGYRRASTQALETGLIDREYRIIRQDGTVRWIRSLGFPVKDENGNLFRMSGITEDITDQKIEMARITEAGRLLSVGELASGVAHEINNPLANIQLYSEAIMEHDLPDPVIEDLKIISAQAKRAATIVRNLLQFARKSSSQASTVSAREFIERCIELKRHDFRINNISASTNILMDTPEITIDEDLMTQVLINILGNAEQACVSANGRGHISVTVREIGGSTRISIADDGPGIPSVNLSKVFDPFFTTKEVGEGTGLGLSVSYGIIAQLGGKLWAESDGLKGSTFHIEVPPPESARFSEPTDSGEPLVSLAGSPLKVMVVDDEMDLRSILVRILQRHGYIVEQAGDGEEAWRKLQEGYFDCILLDLRMAGVDGQNLFQRISASDPGMAAKVIFITGDLANRSTRSFLQPLSNAVLEKPISIGDLSRALAELVAK